MYTRDKLFMVVLIGPAGAGKTTLAEFLKNNLSYSAHVSSDNIKRFISQFREIDSHNRVSFNVALAMANEYLNNRVSVIFDKNMSSEDVQKLKDIADKHTIDFFLYRIEAHPDLRTQRIAERTAKTNKPMMSKEGMDKLSKRYEENSYPGNAVFDSGKLTIEDMAEKVFRDLNVL